MFNLPALLVVKEKLQAKLEKFDVGFTIEGHGFKGSYHIPLTHLRVVDYSEQEYIDHWVKHMREVNSDKHYRVENAIKEVNKQIEIAECLLL